ncbi:MAG: NAD(P)H-dependent oxidoreductase subunit E [Desulfobacteraceae bacterium]|nr:MAG: NAD(P)H-dependent oxidoreductase subunit E [Desulfobacteraceae bacterium]
MKEDPADIDDILEKYPAEPQFLISALQDVQAKYGYISRENMAMICDHVGAPLTQAWSVATFYKSFRLEPRGEHEICVCLGTACHLRGAERIVQALEKDLVTKRGSTTKDQRYSLDTVNCLGACSMAPVVKIDEEYIGGADLNIISRRLQNMQKEKGETKWRVLNIPEKRQSREAVLERPRRATARS